jgi:phospholipase/lecithinase/hemolysin
MKQASNNTGVVRFARIAVACAAFATLVACGGGSDNNNNNNASTTPAGGVQLQVVSFGDSLSDAGTYSPVIASSFGGGRFTTNPGEVWTQKIAEYYGGTLTPAYVGGFGKPLAPTGGLGYAQGGALISTGAATSYAGATTWPVSQQVQQYITDHGSFNSNQLVLINGGANDIIQNLNPLLASMGASLATNPAPTQNDVIAAATVALHTYLPNQATAFATQIGSILAHGATHVVVMNVPDIGKAPLAAQAAATANNAQVPALISALVGVYNATVQGTLQATGLYSKIIWADAATWTDTLVATYQSQGFTNATGTACAIDQMQKNATAYATANPAVLVGGMTAAQYGQQFASALFCAPNVYVAPGADQSYVFADQLHPTTHAHAAFATFVESKIAATGLGK